MSIWLAAAVVLASARLVAGLRVHRYSRRHVVAQLTIAGRGIYFSRTPDGDWWALRLRRPRAAPACSWPASGGEPPDIGVREPRRPSGPGPRAAAACVELPRPSSR